MATATIQIDTSKVIRELNLIKVLADAHKFLAELTHENESQRLEIKILCESLEVQITDRYQPDKLKKLMVIGSKIKKRERAKNGS